VAWYDFGMDVIVRKTDDVDAAFKVAQKLPDFFNAGGLKQIEEDTKRHILYGAYLDAELVGFATYKEINPDAVEMSWLAVLPEKQGLGVGAKLVNDSLNELGSEYKVCEVKTLSETSSYEPYKKTRSFYKNIGFVPIETIDPYPGWGEGNPCQIFVRFIGKI
jgi:ribosomal protein S18 acetylase RimI-like enzyme